MVKRKKNDTHCSTNEEKMLIENGREKTRRRYNVDKRSEEMAGF